MKKILDGIRLAVGFFLCFSVLWVVWRFKVYIICTIAVFVSVLLAIDWLYWKKTGKHLSLLEETK